MSTLQDNAEYLHARIAELERANVELSLRVRALEVSTEGITISDAGKPDNPLIYVNAGFEQLTGYSREEVLQRNCRFLQGEETPSEALEQLREATRNGEPCTVELLNYRKDGTPFWNRLSITPLRDADGTVTHYVGIQSDISRRMEAEEEVRSALELLEATNQQLTRANRRMKYNLEAAARVQQSLLPEEPPCSEGVCFDWQYRPSDELAGDILNVFPIDDTHWGLYVLDVSGHGTAAALLAVAVSHFLTPASRGSSLVRRRGEEPNTYRPVPPAEVADKLNKQFPWDAEKGQFFTLVYGVLDVASGVFRYVTAGHPGPLYLPAGGEPVVPREGSYPIGLAPDLYTEKEVQLRPGDRLYLYSDGLTDVHNSAGEMFAHERLADHLNDARELSLSASLSSLLRRLEDWNGSPRFKDDVSVLGLEIPPQVG
jgi:PAS domain S-box-containing protein